MSKCRLIQKRLLPRRERQPIPDVTYSKPQYNKIKGDKQRIELSRGCPNNCPYCFEPHAKTKDDVNHFSIPEIKRNYVQILDMNFLWQENVLEKIRKLGKIRVNNKVVYYEEVCGFDYRYMDQEVCNALKKARFVKPRIAWDWTLNDQYKLKDTINMLKKAGYKPHEIMVFIIVNWKMPYEDCLKKLDLLKVWSVKVCDCCYDGGYRHAVPEYWSKEEIVNFRMKSRKHNQIVNFGIDPEVDAPNEDQKNLNEILKGD